jgi:hypothetical protein
VTKLRVYHRVRAGRPIRVVWALEEVGAEYELVAMSAEEAGSAEHRARHPLGPVPVLEDEDGPMFESTALVFHIAELYPKAGLLPPPATHERAVVQGWSIFAMTELEAPAIEYNRQRDTNPAGTGQGGRALRRRGRRARGRAVRDTPVPSWLPVHRRRHRHGRGAGHRRPRRRDRTVTHDGGVRGIARRATGMAAGGVEARSTRADVSWAKSSRDTRKTCIRARAITDHTQSRDLRCAGGGDRARLHDVDDGRGHG